MCARASFLYTMVVLAPLIPKGVAGNIWSCTTGVC
jgi:hypothetical protein